MTFHILFVEDDEALRRVARRALENARYTISEAGDGQSAIESFARERPDLIVTDLKMPRTDGLQTLAHFRRHHPEVPVLAISSSDNRTFLDMALAFGAAGAIEKPFTMERLVSTVREILETPARDEPE